jgi:hypothetical protein
MRSRSAGKGFDYFSGPLKDLGNELVAKYNRIFCAAADGFTRHGRGAVLWSERVSFLPQAKVVAELADAYATKCVGEYEIGQEAMVLVRRPEGEALFVLASRRHRVRRGARQLFLGGGPETAARQQRIRVVIVEASVIWSRGFVASAAEAARRADQPSEALPVTDGYHVGDRSNRLAERV